MKKSCLSSSDKSELAKLLDNAVPGIPSPVKPDKLYAVFYPPLKNNDAKAAFGAIVYGAWTNWLYKDIVAHYELPIIITPEQAHKFLDSGA